MLYRRSEDSHAYVLGRKLIAYALIVSNSGYCLSDISYQVLGRPIINGYNDFNVSHSGSVVVCVVSASGSIGIDIEIRRPLDVTEFRHQFSIVEWNRINQSPSPLNIFYDYWTRKEAVLKADGRGLVDDLAALDVSHLDKVLLDNKMWYLKKIDDFENYACHVASSEPQIAYTLKDLSSWIYDF